MKLFSNPGTQRSIAFAVLLVWLVALASGVANACLLEPRGTPSQTVAAGSSKPADAAVADHDDDSHNAKAPCLKVCDAGSHTLTTTPSEADATDPGLAPVVTVLWTAARRVGPETGRVHDLHPPDPGPPLRVRYSRLAL